MDIMMITVTVVRTRPTPRDRYGDQQAVQSVERFPVRLAYAPRTVGTTATAEMQDRGREGIARSATLFAPTTADIRRDDRLEFFDALWEVEGEPGLWVSALTDRKGGKEIAVRRVEG